MEGFKFMAEMGASMASERLASVAEQAREQARLASELAQQRAHEAAARVQSRASEMATMANTMTTTLAGQGVPSRWAVARGRWWRSARASTARGMGIRVYGAGKPGACRRLPQERLLYP